MPKKNRIDRVREIALALPETSERLSHGEPTWFVRTKVFASWEDHHHGDPIVGLWLNAPAGLQEMLVSAQPECFYRPKYVGHKGWIGVNMEGPLDWGHVADLIRDSYRLTAPKKLAEMVGQCVSVSVCECVSVSVCQCVGQA